MGVTEASKINEGDYAEHSMIFSLVNAEEYGWLVKTVSELQSDKDSTSDQRSNSSNNSRDGDDGVRARRPRHGYAHSSVASSTSGSGSDTASRSSGQVLSISALSSGGTSQGDSISSRQGDAHEHYYDKECKLSPKSSGSDEKSEERDNTTTIKVGVTEKGSNTSVEGSDNSSLHEMKHDTRKRKASHAQDSDPQIAVGQELDSLSPKTMRTRSSRRFGR